MKLSTREIIGTAAGLVVGGAIYWLLQKYWSGAEHPLLSTLIFVCLFALVHIFILRPMYKR